MKYVSIDIETTGTDEKIHQIIEFAAIIEDSENQLNFDEIPKFRRIVLNPEKKYVFSSYASNLNKDLIETISKIENDPTFVLPVDPTPNLDESYCYDYVLGPAFKDFLVKNGVSLLNLNASGKNFSGFDKKFLLELGYFKQNYITFSYRTIDPASSFIDWKIDKDVPSTSLCKQRAKLGNVVLHKALQDAWDVILLNRFLRKEQLILKSQNQYNFDLF